MENRKVELKISAYLKDYYKQTEDTKYQTEVIDARNLLIERRFDLAAKIYYIQCRQNHQGMDLAYKLYDAHIMAFQDGIVEETGKHSKRGLDCYHRVFAELIDSFSKDEYDMDREWIPVDKFGQILDGAHRVACAIYFNKCVKIVHLPKVQGHKFDYAFFQRRGLEKGYAEIMAAIFAKYKQDTVAILVDKSGWKVMKRWCRAVNGEEQKVFLVFKEKLKHGKEIRWGCVFYAALPVEKIIVQAGGTLVRTKVLLKLEEKELAQQITVTRKQEICLKTIRKIRHRYTALLLRVKKKLGMPT